MLLLLPGLQVEFDGVTDSLKLSFLLDGAADKRRYVTDDSREDQHVHQHVHRHEH